MNGVAITTRSDVVKFAQTSSGMLQNVIPGARMVMIVTRKLRAVMIELAPANPWRALTLEWQVTSPPPTFNFDEIPQVVGNPYEYGVPGAKHAIFGYRLWR